MQLCVACPQARAALRSEFAGVVAWLQLSSPRASVQRRCLSSRAVATHVGGQWAGEGSPEERSLNLALLQEALRVEGSNQAFAAHKASMLERTLLRDRSPKGCVDRRAVGILRELNHRAEYATTSSCSGRVLFVAYTAAAEEGAVTVPGARSKVERTRVSHDGILDVSDYFALDFQALRAARRDLWLMVQPFSLHVSCASAMDAQRLVVAAGCAPGISASVLAPTREWRTVVNVEGRQRLEMPFALSGQPVYSGPLAALGAIVNGKLGKNWAAMEELLVAMQQKL